MTIFGNKKHRHSICLKVGDRFFTFLTMLQAKASVYYTIKENLSLHCRKFSPFPIAVIILNILTIKFVSQRNTACNRNRYLCNRVVSVS